VPQKQVDGESRGLELGSTGVVALEDVAEDPADVIAADLLAPRAACDRQWHELVTVGTKNADGPPRPAAESA